MIKQKLSMQEQGTEPPKVRESERGTAKRNAPLTGEQKVESQSKNHHPLGQ